MNTLYIIIKRAAQRKAAIRKAQYQLARTTKA